MQVLGPLSLDDGPESFYGVQLAAICWQEQLLKVLIVHLIQLLRMVDPQIVEHHNHSPALAFVLQCVHEVEKQIGVVVLHEYFKMHEAPLLADCPDNCY